MRPVRNDCPGEKRGIAGFRVVCRSATCGRPFQDKKSTNFSARTCLSPSNWAIFRLTKWACPQGLFGAPYCLASAHALS